MKWLSVDPGDSTGWALWNEGVLVDAGTTPRIEFRNRLSEDLGLATGDNFWRVSAPDLEFAVCRLVAEDFRLRPNELRRLAWDECRTARSLGALELLAHQHDLEFVLQQPDKKDYANAAGAEDYFPAGVTVHAKDAIRHGVYYLAKNGGLR